MASCNCAAFPAAASLLCSRCVVLDFVAHDELGAGVAGLGGVELGAEGSEGAAECGQRAEPDGEGSITGDDVTGSLARKARSGQKPRRGVACAVVRLSML